MKENPNTKKQFGDEMNSLLFSSATQHAQVSDVKKASNGRRIRRESMRDLVARG